jgi:hypothetical protein
MIHSLVSKHSIHHDYMVEFKKVMVLLEKAGKERDSRLAGSLTK